MSSKTPSPKKRLDRDKFDALLHFYNDLIHFSNTGAPLPGKEDKFTGTQRFTSIRPTRLSTNLRRQIQKDGFLRGLFTGIWQSSWSVFTRNHRAGYEAVHHETRHRVLLGELGVEITVEQHPLYHTRITSFVTPEQYKQLRRFGVTHEQAFTTSTANTLSRYTLLCEIRHQQSGIAGDLECHKQLLLKHAVARIEALHALERCINQPNAQLQAKTKSALKSVNKELIRQRRRIREEDASAAAEINAYLPHYYLKQRQRFLNDSKHLKRQFQSLQAQTPSKTNQLLKRYIRKQVQRILRELERDNAVLCSGRGKQGQFGDLITEARKNADLYSFAPNQTITKSHQGEYATEENEKIAFDTDLQGIRGAKALKQVLFALCTVAKESKKTSKQEHECSQTESGNEQPDIITKTRFPNWRNYPLIALDIRHWFSLSFMGLLNLWWHTKNFFKTTITGNGLNKHYAPVAIFPGRQYNYHSLLPFIGENNIPVSGSIGYAIWLLWHNVLWVNTITLPYLLIRKFNGQRRRLEADFASSYLWKKHPEKGRAAADSHEIDYTARSLFNNSVEIENFIRSNLNQGSKQAANKTTATGPLITMENLSVDTANAPVRFAVPDHVLNAYKPGGVITATVNGFATIAEFFIDLFRTHPTMMLVSSLLYILAAFAVAAPAVLLTIVTLGGRITMLRPLTELIISMFQYIGKAFASGRIAEVFGAGITTFKLHTMAAETALYGPDSAVAEAFKNYAYEPGMYTVAALSAFGIGCAITETMPALAEDGAFYPASATLTGVKYSVLFAESVAPLADSLADTFEIAIMILRVIASPFIWSPNPWRDIFNACKNLGKMLVYNLIHLTTVLGQVTLLLFQVPFVAATTAFSKIIFLTLSLLSAGYLWPYELLPPQQVAGLVLRFRSKVMWQCDKLGQLLRAPGRRCIEAFGNAHEPIRAWHSKFESYSKFTRHKVKASLQHYSTLKIKSVDLRKDVGADEFFMPTKPLYNHRGVGPAKIAP